MENPASWGRAEHAVAKAIKNFDASKAEEGTAGLSLVRQITDTLRREGLLILDTPTGRKADTLPFPPRPFPPRPRNRPRPPEDK